MDKRWPLPLTDGHHCMCRCLTSHPFGLALHRHGYGERFGVWVPKPNLVPYTTIPMCKAFCGIRISLSGFGDEREVSVSTLAVPSWCRSGDPLKRQNIDTTSSLPPLGCVFLTYKEGSAVHHLNPKSPAYKFAMRSKGEDCFGARSNMIRSRKQIPVKGKRNLGRIISIPTGPDLQPLNGIQQPNLHAQEPLYLETQPQWPTPMSVNL